ncbi:hypothetical protein PRIPAC_75718 [Pristionchus pacificus]|uniref:AMP-binding protein n=1 Tax=Pristionchus pacificus TaxID=54126 RepID=A0A2A6CA51_PRIPA|nr:hypothetical protein PRIPAC_75718 [Pristionchus pacificus]|eukprot:PDM74901.1 AMP-binding protein [Pristionchus pacificus]
MVYKSPFPPVPVCTESLPSKLLRAIKKHGDLYPKKNALVSATDPTKCLTFHELHTQAHSVRAFLHDRGFKVGDVACLVLGNCLEWPVFQLGVMAAGGAVSGASAMFTGYELERQFLDSHCTVVLTDEDNVEKVMKAAKNCEKVTTIVCLRNSSSRPWGLPQRVVDWSSVVSCKPKYEIPNVDPKTMAVLPYSSGTTGAPKGVMLSHQSVGTVVDIFKDHFDREVFSVIGPKNHSWYNELFLLILPYYHIHGFVLLQVALFSGATSVVVGKFVPKQFLGAIEKFRPRVLFTVPPILVYLAKQPLVLDFDCSSVEFVLCGSAPVGKDICIEFLARHKNVKYLCQRYGMTECAMGSHLPVLNVKDPFMGVGKAVSNLEMKLVDVNNGKEVGVGERGEVWIRTPTLMMGYLNRPEATAETIDKEGWLHTGDIGYMEADGRTFIVDRLKEIIKVKGFQVAPAEIEDLLLSHPQIRDAAVIGIPDTRMGELVRVYVVRANETLTEDDVIKFVAQKVSSYKHITGGVKFVTEVSKSPSGKILRRFLRDEVANEMKSKI